MSRNRRALRKKSAVKAGRIAPAHPVLGRRSLFERLEDRRMLTGFFNTIADDISAPGGAMSTIELALQGVDTLTRLPLINKPISQIGQLTDAFSSFQDKLDSTLRLLGPTSLESDIRTAIYTALGPEGDGLDVLASKSGAPKAVPSDVVVTVTSSSVDISIDLGYTSDQFASAIGLGVDSVPLKPQDTSRGAFTVGLKYHDFHFGYDNNRPTDKFYFTTDTAHDELQLTLKGYLPNSFTAGLGFLNVLVTDKTPGTDPGIPGDPNHPGDADMSLKITADVTGGLGAHDPPIGIESAHISGGVNLDATVEVQASGSGMPKITTELIFNWTLPDVDANVPLGGAWRRPRWRSTMCKSNWGRCWGASSSRLPPT